MWELCTECEGKHFLFLLSNSGVLMFHVKSSALHTELVTLTQEKIKLGEKCKEGQLVRWGEWRACCGEGERDCDLPKEVQENANSCSRTNCVDKRCREKKKITDGLHCACTFKLGGGTLPIMRTEFLFPIWGEINQLRWSFWTQWSLNSEWLSCLQQQSLPGLCFFEVKQLCCKDLG